MQELRTQGKVEWRGENHPNGSPKLRIPLVDGEPHGDVRQWWDNGRLRFQITYVHGQRHGALKFWYRSGARESVRHYAHGEKQGPFTDWYESGRVAAEGRYEDDQLAEVHEWDELGNRLLTD